MGLLNLRRYSEDDYGSYADEAHHMYASRGNRSGVQSWDRDDPKEGGLGNPYGGEDSRGAKHLDSDKEETVRYSWQKELDHRNDRLGHSYSHSVRGADEPLVGYSVGRDYDGDAY